MLAHIHPIEQFYIFTFSSFFQQISGTNDISLGTLNIQLLESGMILEVASSRAANRSKIQKYAGPMEPKRFFKYSKIFLKINN